MDMGGTSMPGMMSDADMSKLAAATPHHVRQAVPDPDEACNPPFAQIVRPGAILSS
jgi:hypothetical protein